ncbi:t-SNARE affecting a late Golgi compartment protein 2 [Ophidiomyces ophidiicola]|uniref:t-SNARE affecting a late Golgi compartment protein 2 n=1 Tax=Ophidiomyces ophidiicola TaxID=1387563 RepID=A0ACB8V8Q3_9EURO|nr:t-SNARE affecting a late Golgi compartment protein 2 [Ophidiomyces ophidiicola]KAI1925605.1 t-SNARE affecting a late Golgi compartment protein 2 [Ophidiomyces ophidiicola]KAI2148024.1 t-SNARE affecting a late Golgi compartment protein 2 [Ophidiomyces ophidiicola]KAI2193890.1 t-SNARE affecting a late Golgi compartment protein 2 [Ophidiomyces ophidiicola]KAI2383578.1 t-SNARE affecting a late Golgi compartment protein 2 [Ophidiomyces ophidiicola]
MWRDRTNLYISYRQSFAHHPAKKPRHLGGSWTDDTSEERRGLMSGGAGFDDDGDAIIEMDLLPPRWLDVQDEVLDLLRGIGQKSAQLDKLHQKHVLPSFGDEDVRQEEESVIERLTQEITRAFHDCQRNIQKIDVMVRDARQPDQESRGEETMARNLQISLAAKVQEASAGFRKKQSTYLKKLRSLDGLSSPIDRSPTPILHQNPYTDPSLLESDADKSYSQSTLLQTSQQQRQLGRNANDAAIVQREREINDIAKGIIELSDIFRDLQTMIIDQGTMLDRIDYNVERMNVDVKAADKELTVATGYQRRTTKRKILLLLFLLIVGMLVLLLVKPKRYDSAPPKPPPQTSSGDIQKIEARPPARVGSRFQGRRVVYPPVGTVSDDDALRSLLRSGWDNPPLYRI